MPGAVEDAVGRAPDCPSNGRHRAAMRMALISSHVQMLLEQLIDLFRAGLAAAYLHHLSDEETQQLDLSALVRGDGILVLFEYFQDEFFDRSRIVDDDEILVFYDLSRGFAFRKHIFE